MDVALWVVAALLAVAFAAGGAMKLAQSKQALAATGQMDWVEDFSQPTIRMIGALEVAAAVGLVLPPLVDLAAVLAPLAATGLVLLMAGAALTHTRRGELPMVAINVVLAALAGFVAWGRFGPYSFS